MYTPQGATYITSAHMKRGRGREVDGERPGEETEGEEIKLVRLQ